MPIAPTYLISTVFELDGSRDEIEEWFRRAWMRTPTIDGRAQTSWRHSTRIGGSVDALMAFARWCRETGNWDGGIPQAAVDALNASHRYQPGILESPRDGRR